MLLALSAFLAFGRPAHAQQADADGPVSPDSAEIIRSSLERPPARPPLDVVDWISLPFQAIVAPLVFIGRLHVKLVGTTVKLLQPREMSLLEQLAEAGFKPRFGTIGPRSGIAAGVLFDRWSPFYIETAYSIRGSTRNIAGLRRERDRYLVNASYMFRRDAQPHFRGIGPDTREDDFVAYRWDRQEISLDGELRRPSITLTGGAVYQDNRVAQSFDDEAREIVDLPEGQRPFGAAERTKYFVLDLNAGFDRSRFTALSRTGYYLELGSAFFLGTDGTDSDFWRINGQLTGFVPINPRQAWALRGIAEYNRGYGQGVPFTHLASLGSLRGGRAYSRDRFRDLAMLAAMSEWRYEIWRELHERGRAETFLLLDTGTVADEFGKMRLSDLKWSYGFGMRLVFEGEVRWLGYLAFGEDGARFDLEFTRVF